MDCIRNITNDIETQSSVNASLACECLPGCFEIKYDTEVSVAPLLPNEEMLQTRGLSAQNVSIMHIFYKYKYLRSQSKDEIIGFTEFLCTFSFGVQFSFLCCMNLLLMIFVLHFSQHRRYFRAFYGLQCIFHR